MQFICAGVRAAVGIIALLAVGATSAFAQSETFSYTGAIVEWTVPETGTYRVTAVGAQGGAVDAYGDEGGRGASVSAEFDFVAGDVYRYAVGQQGRPAATAQDFPNGGGGGTFFVDAMGSEPVPLLIAGGGGGVGSAYGAGRDASTGQNGVTGTNSLVNPAPPGPNSAELGYGGSPLFTFGSGGAGFLGDGQGSLGGKSWANGLAGGGDPANGAGGFGGGGSGMNNGGGGGGGYTGGDGGYRGGGGGSFISGANQESMAGLGTGNGSLTIELVSDGPEETDKAAEIGEFLATRQQLILANGPDLSRRISRFNGGFTAGNIGVSGLGYMSTDLPFNLQVGPNRMRFTYDSASQAAGAAAGVAAGTRSSEDLSGGQLLGYAPALIPDEGSGSVSQSGAVSDLAFWVEGTFASTSDGTMFGILHTGGDLLLTDRILVGIGLSVDSTRQESSVADVEGLGYMIGPYATFQLSDALYLDVRLAAGQSSNSITMLDETDDFSTTRWLGSAALIGDFQFGIVNVAPEARVSMMDERSDAYTDDSGDLVPSVHVSTGTLEIGPRLSLDLVGDGVTWSPYLEGKGIWTFQQQNSGGAPQGNEFEELRARIGAGAGVTTDGAISGRAGVFYDGVGSQLSAWGATLGISGAL